MKRWRLPPAPDTLPTSLVRAVLAGVGTAALAAQVMRALQAQVRMSLCTIYVMGGDGRVASVSAASQYGRKAEDTVARYMAERYDQKDPHMMWLAQRPRPRRQPQFWLAHHHADELADADYRAACYGSVGIRERLSLLWLHPSGQRAAINLYRSLALPPFGPTDFEPLQACAPLLMDATQAHVRLGEAMLVTPPSMDARQRPSLSVREREAIALLQSGLTAAAAAQRMGLALSTFRTHQYRAFRRLQVGSIRELLLQGGAPATAPHRWEPATPR